ncbi:MAG: hypothetical protein AB8D52_10120 [Gammaproteobacteria bacterium]
MGKTPLNSAMRNEFPKGTYLRGSPKTIAFGTVLELLEAHKLTWNLEHKDFRHSSKIKTPFKLIQLAGKGIDAGLRQKYEGTITNIEHLVASGEFRPSFWHANRFIPVDEEPILFEKDLNDKVAPKLEEIINLTGDTEGQLHLVIKYIGYRSQRLAKAAKALYLEEVGKDLPCEHCGFSFKQEHGFSYIHAAHRHAIKNRPSKGSWTPIEGYIMLCPNCHVAADKE